MTLDNAAKKAYELSYALFRVAAVLPSRAFAEVLEGEALDFLRAVAADQRAQAEASLRSLTYLVSFGRDTGKVHLENAELLIGQMETMGSMLGDLQEREVPRAEIEDIFSESEPAPTPVYLGSAASAVNQEAVKEPANENAATKSPANGKAAEERQGIILGRIRDNGNMRARELQDIFPDVSERTLRYDLQRLMEEGSIERIGPGGPASWYRPK